MYKVKNLILLATVMLVSGPVLAATGDDCERSKRRGDLQHGKKRYMRRHRNRFSADPASAG